MTSNNEEQLIKMGVMETISRNKLMLGFLEMFLVLPIYLFDKLLGDGRSRRP